MIKERVSSTFLPTGPLHMLPPAALEGLKLSTKGCNEVLTIALNIDYDTGMCTFHCIFVFCCVCERTMHDNCNH